MFVLVVQPMPLHQHTHAARALKSANMASANMVSVALNEFQAGSANTCIPYTFSTALHMILHCGVAQHVAMRYLQCPSTATGLCEAYVGGANRQHSVIISTVKKKCREIWSYSSRYSINQQPDQLVSRELSVDAQMFACVAHVIGMALVGRCVMPQRRV